MSNLGYVICVICQIFSYPLYSEFSVSLSLSTQNQLYTLYNKSISCLPNMYNSFCLTERGQISGILEMVTNAGQLPPAEEGQDEADEDENRAELTSPCR